MTRYKGRPSAIEKDFPHIVEMRVPLGGLGSKLDAMPRWHEARGIYAVAASKTVAGLPAPAAGTCGFKATLPAKD